MVDPIQPIAICSNYLEMIAAFRARVDQIGMSYETLDQIAGWTSSYSSKTLNLEPPDWDSKAWKNKQKRSAMRALGPMGIDAVLGALGLKLALIEDLVALERVKKSRYFVRKKPRKPANGKQSYIVLRRTRVDMKQIAPLGGLARSAKLSPKRRRSIARKAAKSRWAQVRANRTTDRRRLAAPPLVE